MCSFAVKFKFNINSENYLKENIMSFACMRRNDYRVYSPWMQHNGTTILSQWTLENNEQYQITMDTHIEKQKKLLELYERCEKYREYFSFIIENSVMHPRQTKCVIVLTNRIRNSTSARPIPWSYDIRLSKSDIRQKKPSVALEGILNDSLLSLTLSNDADTSDRLYPYTIVNKLRNEYTERPQPGYIRNVPNFTWLSTRYNADDYEFANEIEEFMIDETNQSVINYKLCDSLTFQDREKYFYYDPMGPFLIVEQSTLVAGQIRYYAIPAIAEKLNSDTMNQLIQFRQDLIYDPIPGMIVTSWISLYKQLHVTDSPRIPRMPHSKTSRIEIMTKIIKMRTIRNELLFQYFCLGTKFHGNYLGMIFPIEIIIIITAFLFESIVFTSLNHSIAIERKSFEEQREIGKKSIYLGTINLVKQGMTAALIGQGFNKDLKKK